MALWLDVMAAIFCWFDTSGTAFWATVGAVGAGGGAELFFDPKQMTQPSYVQAPPAP